jgi:molybdate transport system substrate-binding protein
MRRFYSSCLILWLSLAGVASRAADADPAPITVFAAASLTNALQELGDGYTKQTSIPIRFSFAASSALARQIENGAPADVFFSADLEWMDYLQTRNLIQRDTRLSPSRSARAVSPPAIRTPCPSAVMHARH